MSLRAKDNKSVRGAYKERQKTLFKTKDSRKRKSFPTDKPWKTTKGYSSRAGRETCPGRNYGCRVEHAGTRWFAWMEDDCELEEDGDDTETEPNQEAVAGIDVSARESAYAYDTDTESALTNVDEDENESYEFQLARALSLSLAIAEMPTDDKDEESLQDILDDDYSFLETDSEAMDADSEHETDASGETEWVEVNEFGTDVERPTYAQMMKVEAT